MKFSGRVGLGTRNFQLDFGSASFSGSKILYICGDFR